MEVGWSLLEDLHISGFYNLIRLLELLNSSHCLFHLLFDLLGVCLFFLGFERYLLLVFVLWLSLILLYLRSFHGLLLRFWLLPLQRLLFLRLVEIHNLLILMELLHNILRLIEFDGRFVF